MDPATNVEGPRTKESAPGTVLPITTIRFATWEFAATSFRKASDAEASAEPAVQDWFRGKSLSCRHAEFPHLQLGYSWWLRSR